MFEQHDTERTLRENNDLLERLFSTIHIAVAYMDTDFTFIRVNQAYAAADGYEPAFFVGRNHFDLYPDAENEAIFRRVTETGAPYTAYARPFVFPVHPERGTTYWDWTLQPIKQTGGSVEGLVLSLINVTERVQFEEELRLFKSIIESSEEAVAISDLSGQLVYVNPAHQKLFGYSLEEAQRKNYRDYYPPESVEVLNREVVPALAAGQGWQGELDAYDAQGRRFTLWERANTIRHADGTIRFAFGLMHDTTERKRAEQALRESEARYRTLVDNFPDGVVLLFDQDMRYLVAGGKHLCVVGKTPDMLEGKTLWEAVPPDRAAMEEPLYRATLAGTAPAEVEQHYGVHTYRTQPVSLYNEQGEIVAGMIIAQDITMRKLAEVQMRHANEQLVHGNERLQQRNQEMMLLNQMGDMLLECRGVDEAYEVIALSAAKLFAGQAGALYIRRNATTLFDAVATWGDPPPTEPTLELQRCQALREQRAMLFSQTSGVLCEHLDDCKAAEALCVPLVVRDETLGILHVRNCIGAESEAPERWIQLGGTVARQVSLALHNLMLREQLRQQAIRDSLTGLYNRRYLDETLPREVQRYTRQRQSIGVIMLDIDHFKRFNDTYGHDAGDVLLRALGVFLQTHTRSEDIVCRYGGEEFTLVLPGASLEDMRQRAEELREGVQTVTVQHAGHMLDAVTASLGVAVFPDHSDTVDGIIRAADQVLYQAKRNGRNRVVVAQGVIFTNGGVHGQSK